MHSPTRFAAIGGPPGRWVQSCAVLAIALAMGLSFAAATARLGLRIFKEDQAGLVLLGIAAYLLLAGVAAAALRFAHRRLNPSGFVAGVVSTYFLVLIAGVFSGGSRLQWTGDAALLHQYVQTLAERGYSAETLAPMSDAYDYQVWSRRAVPFYILIHRIAGDAFPAAIQCFNALVMALAALLTWRLAFLLFGVRAAAYALALQVLMPWRIFTHLDLSHHILGGFYYTLGVWILVEWHRPNRSLRQFAGLALAAGILMPLMHLEGGIDFVFAAAVGGTLLLAWLMGKSSIGKTAAAFAALLVLPLLSASIFIGPLDDRLDEADRHHYDSGILAWSTRGWSIETGGQYNGKYEQVDILTPPDLKRRTMRQLIASQVYYHPAAIAFRQVPIKATKYFMAGYASGFEEILNRNHLHILGPLYIGARTAYLLLLLPLAIGGGFLFLVWFRTREGLFFLFPFAVIVGAYVIFGESDPRYSVYFHSYFFLAAGAFLVWIRSPAAEPKIRGRQLVSAALVPALSLLLLFALWSAAVFAVRPLLKKVAVWDMRQASVQGNAPLTVSATLAPFEIHLPPSRTAPTWGKIQLPPGAGQAVEFSFYLLPMAGLSASHGTPVLLRRQTARGMEETPLRLPARVTLALAPADARSFEILSRSIPPPFPLSIGYASLRTLE